MAAPRRRWRGVVLLAGLAAVAAFVGLVRWPSGTPGGSSGTAAPPAGSGQPESSGPAGGSTVAPNGHGRGSVGSGRGPDGFPVLPAGPGGLPAVLAHGPRNRRLVALTFDGDMTPV